MKYSFRIDPTRENIEIDIVAPSLSDDLKDLLDWLEHDSSKVRKRLTYRHKDGVAVVSVEDIYLVSVCGDWLELHTVSGIERIRDRLYKMQEKLPLSDFVQVSKSDILNINYLHHMEDSFSGTMLAILTNGTKVPVSRRYLKGLMKALGV